MVVMHDCDVLHFMQMKAKHMGEASKWSGEQPSAAAAVVVPHKRRGRGKQGTVFVQYANRFMQYNDRVEVRKKMCLFHAFLHVLCSSVVLE